MSYYIISLKHSHPHEEYFTIWRPDNAGYCYSKEQAGVYPTYEKGYHDTKGNMPIGAKFANHLFEKVIYDGQEKLMIKNTFKNRKILKVKYSKKQMIKQKSPKNIEFCYKHSDGEIEVRYRRHEDAKDFIQLIKEHDDLENILGDDCPFFYRYSV